MRYIYTLRAIASDQCIRMCAGDEAGVCPRNHGVGAIRQPFITGQLRLRCLLRIGWLTRVNILRAISEALFNGQGKTIFVPLDDAAIDPIAAAGMRLNPQDAKRRTPLQVEIQSVVREW